MVELLQEPPSAAPDQGATERIPFPHSVEDFGDDPRISYSKTDGKWILEDDDGSEWEYNDALSKWMPSVRPPLLWPGR